MKKKILAIIPARGGSKGLKNKNLRRIGNNSLTSLAIKTCKKVKLIDRIFVSTDSKVIAKESRVNGVQVPFLRSKEISGDNVPSIKVIYKTLKLIEKFYKEKFNIILLIEPTSPLRLSKDIETCIKKFKKFNYDTLWSVSEVEAKFHPLKQLAICKKKLTLYEKKGEKIYARQQLGSTYLRNGVCYIFSRKTILKDKKLMGKKSGFHLVKSPQISIDKLSDLIYARKMKKF